MRAGITGISSLLGFNLALKLLSKYDWEVFALCRDPNSRSVAYLKSFPKFQILIGNIKDRMLVEELVSKVDVIFHLAAISSERLCLAKPEEAVEVNIGASALIAEKASKKGIKMLFSSSASVYESGYFPNEVSPLTSERLYGVTKHTAERVIKIVGGEHNLNFTIFRFCRLFGVGMQRNPIYELFRGWRKREMTRLYESLNSFVEFLYVEDAVDLLTRAIDDTSFDRETFNAGVGIGTSIKNVTELVSKVLGEELPYTVVNEKFCFDVLDVSKLRKTGYYPKFTLEEGLLEMKELGAKIGFF